MFINTKAVRNLLSFYSIFRICLVTLQVFKIQKHGTTNSLLLYIIELNFS